MMFVCECQIPTEGSGVGIRPCGDSARRFLINAVGQPKAFCEFHYLEMKRSAHVMNMESQVIALTEDEYLVARVLSA